MKSSTIKGFNKHVAPKFNNALEYTKTLTKDTVEFVKKNPAKTVRYASASLLGVSAIALLIKGVKDFVETKKQNKILKNFVYLQRDTIDDLKVLNMINNDIIQAKDRTIEYLQK